jgi:NADPH:quinone reductase-like Zn-dependent oxidoreductase
MKACVYEEYGPAEVVSLADVRLPTVADDEVLVRVHASSVTSADWRLRSSTFPMVFWIPGRLWLGLLRPKNKILGMDFAGVVTAIGKAVTRFRVGDRVFGASSPSRLGAHAEYISVAEDAAILHTPASLNDEQAAATPFGANCALQFLRDFGKVQPGQRVLIVGASGAVGVWAVQLARHMGAHVTGVCSTANLEFVKALGAHEVVDYTASRSFADAGSYDLIFDTVGATTFASCRAALTEHGVYLPLNNGFREILQALFTSLRPGRKVKVAISANTRQGLESSVRMIEAGVLRPVVDRTFPMSRIVDAHRRVEGRHKRGTVVVTIAA